MSRKTLPETPSPKVAAAPHPLPSAGGSYAIEAGELRQVAPPTATENANIQAPVTALSTEA